MTLKLTATKTETGIKVVAEGALAMTIDTTYVPEDYLGKYVVDLILDRVYLKREPIVLNDKVVFEHYDTTYEDYQKFVELMNEVK